MSGGIVREMGRSKEKRLCLCKNIRVYDSKDESRLTDKASKSELCGLEQLDVRVPTVEVRVLIVLQETNNLHAP